MFFIQQPISLSLQWCQNEHDGVSNHQPHDGLLNHLFRRRSKKTSKLHVTGLCTGNSPLTGEFPTQRASSVENVSIWWCHHGSIKYITIRLWTFTHILQAYFIGTEETLKNMDVLHKSIRTGDITTITQSTAKPWAYFHILWDISYTKQVTSLLH